jgi:hypothetical protein
MFKNNKHMNKMWKLLVRMGIMCVHTATRHDTGD